MSTLNLLALLLSSIGSVLSEKTYSDLQCPIPCDSTAPEAWTLFHDLHDLDRCSGTLLFRLKASNILGDASTQIYVRSCTTSGHMPAELLGGTADRIAMEDFVFSSNSTSQYAPIEVLSWVRREDEKVGDYKSGSRSGSSGRQSAEGDSDSGGGDADALADADADADVTAALSALDAYITSTTTTDSRTDLTKDEAGKSNSDSDPSDRASSLSVFAKSGKAVAGVYIGARVRRSGIGISGLASAAAQSATNQSSTIRLAAQSCDPRAGEQVINDEISGLVIDQEGDIASVQAAVRSWHDCECLIGNEDDRPQNWEASKLESAAGDGVDEDDIAARSFDSASGPGSPLQQRATCRYIQVQQGDGCWTLAKRCDISQPELQRFNGGGKFCANLRPKQYVCCSPGKLPDFTPQPGPDGICATHKVNRGETCAKIAQERKTSVKAIEANNKQTWGWAGCRNLPVGTKICLGPGNPPFPANEPTADCGPQKSNTQKPADPALWAGLNPCPLNACCTIWGKCGVTSEFCTKSKGPTGNHGTAAPGENGCISNCGTDIVTGSPPTRLERVGYYESYNIERPCNTMRVGAIPSEYTIIHWAFGDLSKTYDVSIGPYEEDWAVFVKQTGYKKIISFGGWAFSTDPSTFDIFRRGVDPDQRESFFDKVVQFVLSNNLDGVDFDWEYPSPPDVQGEGLPITGPEGGLYYLEFLRLVRQKLPRQYTVSIAAPASFWYLKAFPISQIAEVVDYIIYMTYDLHGQWDYGNEHSSPGCEEGNCLRSHINRTETETAFSMITKAGMPANKVYVGQALYGRSFKMTTPGCWRPSCHFTGPESGAEPGRCTGTRGYISNLEIRDIISSGKHKIERHSDPISGDILIYDETEWVSWNDFGSYSQRGGGRPSNVLYIDPAVYTQSEPSVQCKPPCLFVMPPWTLTYTTTITRPPVTTSVTNAWPYISTGQGGVTSTVIVYQTTVTTVTIPPVVTTEIHVSNYEWTDKNDDRFNLTSSIDFPGVRLTQSSTVLTTEGTTTTIPGVVYLFSPPPFPTTTDIPPPPPTSCDACPGFMTVIPGPPKPVCIDRAKCGLLDLDDPVHCIGIGCPSCCCVGSCPGAPPPGETSICATKSTMTDCSVDCSVEPDGPTLSTSCYTTTCSETAVCRSIESTTTSRTTVACPTIQPHRPWFGDQDPAELSVTLGDGGFGGTVVFGGGGGGGGGGPGNDPPPPVTSFIDCVSRGQQPGSGITSGFCICDGSTFAEKLNTHVTPWNNCGYTKKPTSTIDITTSKVTTTNTDYCQVCTIVGHIVETCTSLDNCDPIPTEPPKPPPRCITAHAHMSNQPFFEDAVTLQLWENGDLICEGSKGEPLASDQTVYDFECKDGAKARVTGNIRDLSYTARDGYQEKDVPLSNWQDTHYECAGEGGGLRCSQFESIFATGECDGRCPTVGFCDFRTECDFDAACD